MSNIYYSPDEYGVHVFGEVDLAEPYYSFDLLVVWRDASRSFYFATDSGCSCPAPFENVRSVEDLEGPMKAAELVKFLETFEYEWGNPEYYRPGIVDLIAKVRNAN